MSADHRKTLRHYDISGHARALTFSTYHRVRMLDEPAVGGLVLDAIGRGCKRHEWDVLAYVLMPDHVHLLVFPQRSPDVAKLLFAIKRPSAFRVKRLLESWSSSRLERLRIEAARGPAFRMWEAGAGHDRNIWSRDAIRKAIEYIHLNPVRAGLCQCPGSWAYSSWRQWHEPGWELEEWEPQVRTGLL